MFAGLAFVILYASAGFADVVSTVDGGGQRVSSASYTMDGSVGGIGGLSAGGSVTNSGGGSSTQPAAAKSLTVNATPSSIDEGSTSQLGGWAVMDDDSITMLSGADITWDAPAYPIASIASNGLLAASAVYTNTQATFSGRYLDATGDGHLLVLDSNPDNYGIYAGDSLPDWWQVQYFGVNNPNAAPGTDLDGDGQDNFFEFTAGLVPTDSQSHFALRIEPVPGQPALRNLVFSPIIAGRTYSVEYRDALATPPWISLAGTTQTDNGDERTVTDTGASGLRKFYRVKVEKP